MAFGSTLNQNLKRNAETQDADGLQALSVFSMTKIEALTQQYYVS